MFGAQTPAMAIGQTAHSSHPRCVSPGVHSSTVRRILRLERWIVLCICTYNTDEPNVPNPFAADIVSRLGVCSTSSLLLLLSDDIADDVIVAGNMPSSNVTGPADVVDVVVVNGILTVVGVPGRLVVLTTALADMVDGLLVTLFFVTAVVGANVG